MHGYVSQGRRCPCLSMAYRARNDVDHPLSISAPRVPKSQMSNNLEVALHLAAALKRRAAVSLIEMLRLSVASTRATRSTRYGVQTAEMNRRHLSSHSPQAQQDPATGLG